MNANSDLPLGQDPGQDPGQDSSQNLGQDLDRDGDERDAGGRDRAPIAHFRQSLVWRLPESARLGLPAALRGRGPGQFQGQDFIERVFEEIAAIEARVDDCWRLRVSGPREQRPQLNVMVDDFRLRARIEMDPKRGEPSIAMALGTALAFDDLALFACCNDLMLVPDLAALSVITADKGELYKALGVVGEQREAPLRFLDYRGALDETTFDAGALTFASPSAPWRLAQAGLLSELMLAFVLLHERSHYALGHLDAVAQKGAALCSLSETMDALGAGEAGKKSSERAPRGMRPVLELQADTQAFLLLCCYALAPDGPCRAYEHMLRELDPSPDYALRHLSFERGVRLSLTAAALACLSFQLAAPGERAYAGVTPNPTGSRIQWPGEDGRGGLGHALAQGHAQSQIGAPLQVPPEHGQKTRRSIFGRDLKKRARATHPTPQARLMNMMINTPLLSPLVTRRGRGEFVLSASDLEDANGKDNPLFRALVEDVFTMSLCDLTAVSSFFGAQLSPLKPSAEKGDVEPADWLKDLGAFWLSDDETLNPRPVTDAARELIALQPVEMACDTALRQFQIARFGQETEIEIGAVIEDETETEP